MTRTERNEFNQIRRSMRDYQKSGCLGYGSTLTIRTDAGSEYKQALHSLYTGLISGLSQELRGTGCAAQKISDRLHRGMIIPAP